MFFFKFGLIETTFRLAAISNCTETTLDVELLGKKILFQEPVKALNRLMQEKKNNFR
jgi:hypothetical protein